MYSVSVFRLTVSFQINPLCSVGRLLLIRLVFKYACRALLFHTWFLSLFPRVWVLLGLIMGRKDLKTLPGAAQRNLTVPVHFLSPINTN